MFERGGESKLRSLKIEKTIILFSFPPTNRVERSRIESDQSEELRSADISRFVIPFSLLSPVFTVFFLPPAGKDDKVE